MIYRILSSNLTFAGLMAVAACLAFFIPGAVGPAVGAVLGGLALWAARAKEGW